jgi:hypothetical protein
MTAARPFGVDPVLDALDAAPEADDDMTAEQRAEYEAAIARYEAGQARLVSYEDMPAALEEIGRSHAA